MSRWPAPDGWVDANVLVYLLTGQPVEMARAARTLMQEAQGGSTRLYVHTLMLAETVWVLERLHRVSRSEIAWGVGGLLRSGVLRCDETALVLEALDDYARLAVDFADALLARRAASSDAPLCYTFDSHFDRLGLPHRRPE